MKLYNFIQSLPKDIQLEYYKQMITSNKIDNDLWNKVINYLTKNFKENIDVSSELSDILGAVDETERNQIIELSKNNTSLYNKINSTLYTFEELINLDEGALKKALSEFSEKEVLIAVKGTSPDVREYVLKAVSLDKDLDLGSVSIDEITEIQKKILNVINNLRK